MKDNNIYLLWHQFENPIYKQLQNKEFIPNMSVIDFIFNHGTLNGKIIRENMQNPLIKYKL